MKLLIIGHGRHGKDTVAELMCKHTGMTFASSSEFIAEKVVFPTMPGYADWRECYEDRHQHRDHWFRCIGAYCAEDHARLAKEIIAEHDIYVGMRSTSEFIASRKLFDLIIWVDRAGYPSEGADSMRLKPWDADVVVYNHGSLADLHYKVARLAKVIWKGTI